MDLPDDAADARAVARAVERPDFEPEQLARADDGAADARPDELSDDRGAVAAADDGRAITGPDVRALLGSVVRSHYSTQPGTIEDSESSSQWDAVKCSFRCSYHDAVERSVAEPFNAAFKCSFQ